VSTPSGRVVWSWRAPGPSAPRQAMEALSGRTKLVSIVGCSSWFSSCEGPVAIRDLFGGLEVNKAYLWMQTLDMERTAAMILHCRSASSPIKPP